MGTWWVFFPIDSTQLVPWLPAVCSEAKSTRVICMEKFFLFQNLAFHGILSISIFWPSYIGLDLWPFGLGLWPWPSLLPLATHGDPNNDVGDHLDHFLDMVGAGGCWWVMVGVLVWPRFGAPIHVTHHPEEFCWLSLETRKNSVKERCFLWVLRGESDHRSNHRYLLISYRYLRFDHRSK